MSRAYCFPFLPLSDSLQSGTKAMCGSVFLCVPVTQEAGAGSFQAQGLSGLQSKFKFRLGNLVRACQEGKEEERVGGIMEGKQLKGRTQGSSSCLACTKP